MLCLREIKDLGREKEGNQEGRLLFYQDADYFFYYFPLCLPQTGLDPGGSALPLLTAHPHPVRAKPPVAPLSQGLAAGSRLQTPAG